MRSDEVKLRVLTEMATSSNDPLDKDEIRAKLETARFEEIMFVEWKKRILLRMMLYVLIGILLALTLQPMLPYLASLLTRNHTRVETQPAVELTPLDLLAQTH